MYPAFEMFAYWGKPGTASHRFLPCYLYSPEGSAYGLLSPMRHYFSVSDLRGRSGYPMSMCNCGR
jgi:hypothetical protein